MTEDLVLICGSREFGSKQADRKVAQAVRERVPKLLEENCLIVCGGARGVDTWAAAAVLEGGFLPLVIKPEWRKYGNRAGIIRNIEMLSRGPKLVIAYWDGSSRGTSHTIHEARKRGIPVELHQF
jgi:hypothetical protein